MDTPSSKNGSYLIIAVGFLAVVSLIVGILGLVKATKLEKRVDDLSALSGRMDTVENSAKKAATDAERASSRINGLIVDTNRTLDQVGSEIAALKTSVSGVQKQVADLETRGPRSSSTTAAAGGSAGSGPAPGTLAEDGTYLIKAGDTLGKVAGQFGLTLAEIERANPGVDSRRLRIGQKIVVPKKP